jgi:hypothetical protein
MRPRSEVGASIARLRLRGRTLVSAYPAVYLPLARLKYRSHEGQVIQEDTRIVIDGFPRSGNSFAVVAFQLSQPLPVSIAHHIHAPAQVIRAARKRIPTIVLVRDPEDAILSHVIREPALSLRQALWSWTNFYEHVIPFRDRFVVGDFRVVTTDFAAIVEQVNRKFGTDFVPFEHTEANVRRCFDVIESRIRKRAGSVSESAVPRPSSERAVQKEHLRSELRSRGIGALHARARRLYDAFVGVSERS